MKNTQHLFFSRFLQFFNIIFRKCFTDDVMSTVCNVMLWIWRACTKIIAENKRLFCCHYELTFDSRSFLVLYWLLVILWQLRETAHRLKGVSYSHHHLMPFLVLTDTLYRQQKGESTSLDFSIWYNQPFYVAFYHSPFLLHTEEAPSIVIFLLSTICNLKKVLNDRKEVI